MQRSDIIEIFPDATKEQIDKLMALNGNDINAAKGEYTELESQLKAANEALAATPAVDVNALDNANGRITDLEAKLASMQAAENARLLRERIAKEKNVPAELLFGDTEEVLTSQADALALHFAPAKSKPPLSVADGGEPTVNGGTSPRAQFADWCKDFFE